MSRILALDYGLKRVGVAVTDPLQIIASPLTTVPTAEIFTFLKDYDLEEGFGVMVLGMPVNLNNKATDATSHVKKFAKKLGKQFPQKDLCLVDERFTSKMAFDTMLAGGMKKKERRKKENVDKISAAIILQSYLDSK